MTRCCPRRTLFSSWSDGVAWPDEDRSMYHDNALTICDAKIRTRTSDALALNFKGFRIALLAQH
jgi:hypothetical protein